MQFFVCASCLLAHNFCGSRGKRICLKLSALVLVCLPIQVLITFFIVTHDCGGFFVCLVGFLEVSGGGVCFVVVLVFCGFFWGFFGVFLGFFLLYFFVVVFVVVCFLFF